MPTLHPVLPRLGFNAHSPSATSTSVAFVAPAAIEDGLADRLPRVTRPLVPVSNMRRRTKHDLPENAALPDLPG